MSVRMTQQMGRLAFFIAVYLAALVPVKADYTGRPEVLAFISELTAGDGFDQAELLQAFEEASYQQSIIDAISRPAERVMTWATYQDIFLTKARVEQGKADQIAEIAAEHRGDGADRRQPPGPFTSSQDHGNQEKVHGDWKNGAFGKRDYGEEPDRIGGGAQAHCPVVDTAQHAA